jgi:hypothetical protein
VPCLTRTEAQPRHWSRSGDASHGRRGWRSRLA